MLKLRFASACLALGFLTVGVPHASATVYLSPDGGVNNQDQINFALSNEQARENGVLTVYLKKGVYAISEPILMGSHTVLTGDKNAILQLANGVKWTPDKAMIANRDPQLTYVTISDFQIDGNKSGLGVADCQAGAYDLVSLNHCTQLEINDMYLYRSAGRALNLSGCSQVALHGNLFKQQNGRAVEVALSDRVAVYGNSIASSCADALNVYGSSDVSLYGNLLFGAGNSAGGIQLGSDNAGLISVFANKIYGLHSYGIISSGAGVANSYIHHNIIYGNQGGILLDQDSSGWTVLKFNTIDSDSEAALSARGRNVLAEDNIFSRSGAVSGDLVSRGNCFAHTEGATERDTSVEDAGFADATAHDYHLKSRAGRWSGTEWVTDSSSSACLDRGVEAVQEEPFPNGCKSNPGRYGNTAEASLSGDLSPQSMPPYPDPNAIFTSSASVSDPSACYAGSSNAAPVTEGKAGACRAGKLCSILIQLRPDLSLLTQALFLLSFVLLIVTLILRRFVGQNDLVYRLNYLLRRLFLLAALFLLFFLLTLAAIYLLG